VKRLLAVACGCGLLVIPAVTSGQTPSSGVVACPAGNSSGVTCFNDGTRLTITGTQGPDTLVGTPGADELDGRKGNDNIDSGAGDDKVDGGGGDDDIASGAGNDLLLAGRYGGNDRLDAGPGNDVIGKKSANELGDDVELGGPGNDLLYDGPDDNVLDGGSGDDKLAGRAGNDVMDGGPGDDFVKAGGFAAAGSAGKNARRFAGKIARRKLTPGAYRATLTATDPARNRSHAKRLTFTVVKR